MRDILAERKALGLSRKQLGYEAYVGVQTIKHLETGIRVSREAYGAVCAMLDKYRKQQENAKTAKLEKWNNAVRGKGGV